MPKKTILISLLLITTTLYLTACTPAPLPETYQIIVPADDIATGTPRIPFILYDGENRTADIAAIHITAFDLSDSVNPQEVWSGSAVSYTDYAVPYWVVYPELPTAGFWGLQAIITNHAQEKSTAQFAIQTITDTAAPNIGETVPASINRTLASGADIAELSTAIEPKPALHQLTVAEILQSPRPAIISFNTPAYCQTAFCAPVIGSIETSHDNYKDQVDYLHLEIYKEFDPLVPADEVAEWGLPSEPWTFILDQTGIVTARLAGPVSPRELAVHLDKLLK